MSRWRHDQGSTLRQCYSVGPVSPAQVLVGGGWTSLSPAPPEGNEPLDGSHVQVIQRLLRFVGE